jgi:hypothetical protein
VAEHVPPAEHLPLRHPERPPEVVVGFLGLTSASSALLNRVFPAPRFATHSSSTPFGKGLSGTRRVVCFRLSRFFSRMVTTPSARSRSDGNTRTPSDRRAPVWAAKQNIGYPLGLTGRPFTHASRSAISPGQR